MAGYSIVLNLSGNAVTQTERLADSLWRAQASATRLATALGAVGTAARGIPARPIQGMGGVGGAGSVQAGALTEAIRQNTVVTRQNTVAERQNTAAHRRGNRNVIFSRGFGGSLGPFSWRASNIDAQLGPVASGLLKGANVAGMVTSAVFTIAKTAFKVIAGATLAPMALAGGTLAIGNSMLNSENMSQAIRLLSRRRQAQLSLGAATAERANVFADSLASSYGFDRSAMLSGMTVLTGAGIGGDLNNRITMGQAAELSKIGGLI